jgi:hypothetical protein
VSSGGKRLAAAAAGCRPTARQCPARHLRLGPGDAIDLRGVVFDAAATVTPGAGNIRQIRENANSYDLKLNPTQNFGGEVFVLTAAGHGGTDATDPWIAAGATVCGGNNGDIIAAPHDTIAGGNSSAGRLCRFAAPAVTIRRMAVGLRCRDIPNQLKNWGE